MLFSGAAAAVLGAAGEAGCLLGCAVHHQPMPMINNKTSASAVGTSFRDVDFGRASDFAMGVADRSHGSTIRNKSIGKRYVRKIAREFTEQLMRLIKCCTG